MERVHRTRCQRGRGHLINGVTREVIPARCKSWRDCAYCAWIYGRAVERLFRQVKQLCAFVVFTMPPEFGDWRKKEHISAQAVAMRRLRERLFRRFARRFAMVWTREHNTHGEGAGRLHLNLLWDKYWVEQEWLSKTAEACGFGRIVHISRVTESRIASGEGKGRSVDRYATKCLRYASKELSSQSDWPKGTRRWDASREARAQMQRQERNPDWYWSPFEPRIVEIEGRSYAAPEPPAQREYWLLPDHYLQRRAALGEVQPCAGSSPPIQISWPFR
jgi:hypothetical protein